jgi:hypothetical protein
MNAWIKNDDKLPPEDVFEVLIKVDEPFFGKTNPRMLVGYYDHENNRWRCDLTSRDVHHATHWMPLPMPPLKSAAPLTWRKAGETYARSNQKRC